MIDKEQIKHLADLARLDFRDEAEQEALRGRLESIIEFAKLAQGVDTEGVAPTNQVTGLLNIYREDVAEPYPEEMREKLFQNVPKMRDGYVGVPHAIKRFK